MYIFPLQRAICAFILQYVEAEQWPPSIREIGAHLGITSTGLISYHLSRLIALGYVERKPGGNRCIRLTPAGREVAEQFISQEHAA